MNIRIKITPSFLNVLVELNRTFQNNMTSSQKILNLIYIMCETYYKEKFNHNENNINNNIDEIMLLHNNLEMLLYLICYYLIFNLNGNDNEGEVYNMYIKIKNFSSSLINEVISSLIQQLTIEMTEPHTFTSIGQEGNYKQCQQMLNTTQELIFSFFKTFKKMGIQRELVFNLNYMLSLYFDVLNRKITLGVNYEINDIKSILNFNQEIVSNLKKNFEEISKGNIDLGIVLTNILEKNMKYKKFQELLFVLNANLKEIRNFVINANFQIHIDKNELITLIKEIFVESEMRKDLITFISERL